jgi:hypothetical protein
VDLAHCSAETVDAALKITTKPVLISHTGLDTQLGNNPRMANMMKPRLISKERAKIVADAGGVPGVWIHLADTPLAYGENVRALADIAGVDHVCIGTGTKLTPAYRSPGAPGPGFGNRDQRPGSEQGQQPGNNSGGRGNASPQG